MPLVEFTSDQGRGYQHASVFINPCEVAAVENLSSDRTSSDNRTTITLRNGEKFYVRGYPNDAAKKIAAAEGGKA
jgi:uncharacterized protein YlzI (FlbEa/FlbD family)